MLQDVFNKFENLDLKDQKTSVSTNKKLLCKTKVEMSASKFKPLRGLDEDEIHIVLRDLKNQVISLKEMHSKTENMKGLKVIKKAMVKRTGCKDWAEVVNR